MRFVGLVAPEHRLAPQPVLAAYYAGGRAFERYRGVPPHADTCHCVQRLRTLPGGRPSHPFDPVITAPSGALRAARRR